MKTAAISDLKAKLSEYLTIVKAGDDILITDRGNPVARLCPIAREKKGKESLANMERQGLIKLGQGNIPKDFWSKTKAEDPKGLVRQALIEERESGR
jgi:prevent-host-death family protein